MNTDVTITSMRVHLLPREGRPPVEPVILEAAINLSQEGFLKIVTEGMRKAKKVAPVDLELIDAVLVDGGAQIAARVKRGLLRAELRFHLEFSVADGQAIRVRVGNVDAPAWVPVNLVLDQGMQVADGKPGIGRVAGDARAIDVDPRAMLIQLGLPLRLAEPGMWGVNARSDQVTITYAPA